MNEVKFGKELEAIREILKRIERNLAGLAAKTKREWIVMYYDSVATIPNSFNSSEWEETEKTMYESIVEEVNGHFTATGTFNSSMRKKLLKLLESERQKLLRGSSEAP